MNPAYASSKERLFKNHQVATGISGKNQLQPWEDSNRHHGKTVRSLAASLKKTRTDYEEQLKSVLKGTGLQTVRSLPKLPLSSAKIYKFDMEKIESLRHKYWESKYQEKIHSDRGQKKKVTFFMASPKNDPKKIDYTKLLNQDIFDFERRLEDYKNSLKHQG